MDPKTEDRRDEACPICAGARFETLHRQEFILPGEIRTHYDVVACEDCGFTFAQDLPTPEQYEAYYRTNLKYTYEGSRDTSQALLSMYEGSYEIVDRALSHALGSRILDIGCSTGELLHLFQRNGYNNLDGVDPSPECREIAKRLYGLDIRTAVLSELQTDEPYDVVLFANVLEHIPDLNQAIARVAALVKQDGLLFIQLPDAGNFGADMKEPFFEFSIEHINYFTEQSLANLLAKAGLTRVDLIHDVLAYKGTSYPVLTSVWRKTGEHGAIASSDTSAIHRYIARSNQRLAELTAKIDALVASGEPLVIWGVGSLTARLLATTNLGRANITGFVDSNPGHQGKRLIDREIAAPSTLRGGSGTILVSSFAYGPEIRNTLEREFRYAGRIVTI